VARFGKIPVEIPSGVEVEIEHGQIRVKGPKGEVLRKLPPQVEIKVGNGKAEVGVGGESKQELSLQGTYRSHLVNMIKGVTDGWGRQLEMVGAGYRAEVRGNDLVLAVGYSHPVTITAPEGVSFGVEKSIIKVDGIDLEVVAQTAAKIRAVRPPEPYKGKGIRYVDEYVRRKPGKAAAKTEGAA